MAFKDLLNKATAYFNPKQSGVNGFWGGKVAQTLISAQKFIENPQSFKVVPNATIRPTDTFIPKAAKTIYNLPADIINSVVGKGVLNVASDVGNQIGRTIRGEEMSKYNDLKSAPARLGYQLSGKLNPSRIKDLAIPMTAQETIGNVAGAAEAPLNAYSGGKTFGIGKNAVAEASAKTFASLLKKIPRLALEGAKMGGTAGFFSGLDQGRNAENIVEQFKQGGRGATQGAAAGAILAPAASVLGYGVNKVIPDKFKVKATPEKPVEMVNYDSNVDSPKIKVVTDPQGVKTILGKIAKGEQAIKQGGWGNNKFSPEEMAGIQQAIDDYKLQLGQKPKVSRSPLPKLPANLTDTQAKATSLGQDYEQSLMASEQASGIRSMLGTDQIKDINKLKMIGANTLANGGDIETLRQKYPKLVESVLSHVRESNPNIVDDTEALQFALELPKAADTKAPMPKELGTLNRSLEKIDQLKNNGVNVTYDANGKAVAVNAEPAPTTVGDIIQKGKKAADLTDEADYKAWQRSLFESEKAKGGISNPLDVLTKSVKDNTNAAGSGLDFADNWKGKSRLSFARETMTRNFEDVMGKEAPAMKQKYLEPIATKEAERTRWLNKERSDIKELGIAPRSQESALVQDYGEGNITAVELRKMTDNPDKIIKAADVLRNKYDSYIKQLNVVLERNGYDPVHFRKDYFHHFTELLTSFEVAGPFHKIGQALKVNELPTDINGLTADFKPGRQFFNALLERKGDVATPDAIQGIDKYLEGASNQIFHTDNIKRLRSLEEEIRKRYAGEEHLTNFAADLGEFTNTLAGKKAMFDRGAESWFGRKVYTVANTVKSQVGANMVGANVSSALTNFIPLTQTIATTDKLSVAQALADTFKNAVQDDGFINKSDFLTRRMGSDPLTLTKWESIGKKAGWLFSAVDKFTSQIVTRSKYLEAIKQGLPEAEAMKKANDWAARLMADRSKGATPTMFNSKTMGLLTQFQLEVNNQMSFVFKDIPRNSKNWKQAASQIAQVALYGWLYNNLSEKITGRRAALDPIGVVQNAVEDYNNPDMKKGKATANLVENVANQLPFTSVLTGGRIPIASGIPNPIAVMTGDSTTAKELKKLAYVLPPFGGGQAMKTIDGLTAYSKGASIAPSGTVRYPIPKTMTNMLRTGVFGQWSTPEAQKYLRQGMTPLGEKQSATYKKLEATDPASAESYYNNAIAVRSAKAEAKAIRDEIMQPKKTWFKNMFAKKAGAADTSVSTDPLDQMVQKEKDRQTKRTLINDIQYGADYQGLTAEQKKQIYAQEGVTESDLAEAKLSNMRSLTPSNRAELIMKDNQPDFNALYKNEVLTPEVAKELERKGYIKNADQLMETMKLTDPYYIRKEKLKSMEKMLKTQADTQKKLIKAQYDSVPKMLKAVSARRKSTMKKTMKIQKITQPTLPKASAYKIKPI